MPRRPSPQRRDELEDAVVGYVLTNGIADLSLRPLADALGVSTYSLVYHFGSKDGVLAAVVARIEERERAMTASWLDEPGGITLGGIMRRYWEEWCLPEALAPYHRLFYEIHALSLQHPQRFPGFLEQGAYRWLPFIRDLAVQSGLTEPEAEMVAALMASTVAGALLVLLSGGERDVTTAAVHVVAAQVDAIDARAGG